MPLGQRFDEGKAFEAVLYVAERVRDRTVHRVCRLLYLADKHLLAKHGLLILSDRYVAMKHGPMPLATYALILEAAAPLIAQDRDLPFQVDSRFVVEPSRAANLQGLSQVDIDSLDAVIAEHGNLSADELSFVTCDRAWQSAKECDFISVEAMAAATPDPDALLAYIRTGYAD